MVSISSTTTRPHNRRRNLVLGIRVVSLAGFLVFLFTSRREGPEEWTLLNLNHVAATSRNANVPLEDEAKHLQDNVIEKESEPRLPSVHHHKQQSPTSKIEIETVQRIQTLLTEKQISEHQQQYFSTDSTLLSSTSNSRSNTNSTFALLPIHRPHHKLPPWMLEYFVWHRQQRSSITEENWNNGSFQYLILRCLKENRDPICGGTSDRLSSLPFQLLMGHEHKRILLIYWERPFPLEEFLLPPQGGLDWRVPLYMVKDLPLDDWAMTNAPRVVKNLASKQFQDKMIIWIKDQTHNHGRSDYNQYHEARKIDSNFDDVFHDAWRMLLTPAPPVAKQTEYWMRKLKLIPGHYASTHVRALYGVANRSLEKIQTWTHNAIHCTTQLLPEGPFFFASDSTDAQKVALQYGIEQNMTIVSRFHKVEPLHLETNSTGKQPSDYYDIFVDIYLLGNAKAVAYNVGGYGRLGLMLGFDAQAGIQHQRGGVPWREGVTGVHLAPCQLKRPTTSSRESSITATTTTSVADHPDNNYEQTSFFVPPMQAADLKTE